MMQDLIMDNDIDVDTSCDLYNSRLIELSNQSTECNNDTPFSVFE